MKKIFLPLIALLFSANISAQNEKLPNINLKDLDGNIVNAQLLGYLVWTLCEGTNCY